MRLAPAPIGAFQGLGITCPGPQACLALAERIVMEGFVSSGEVLYLSHMPVGDLSENWGIEGENAILPFSLGFVKGSARMSTLLCVLHICSTRGCNLQMDCPPPPLGLPF